MKYLLRALTFALTLSLSLSGFVFADSDRSQDAGQDKANKDDKKDRDEKQKLGRLLAGAGELVQNGYQPVAWETTHYQGSALSSRTATARASSPKAWAISSTTSA